MRGSESRSGSLFSYVDLEARVPASHPLRLIREIANEALAALDQRFAAAYARRGRPSIPPERLLRALLLQAFFSVRSERQLMERLDYDLLFRWFVGLGVDDPVWDVTVFTKNRDRLLASDAASAFLAAIAAHPKVRRLMSREHFTVDGTLIEAWASMKSFQPVAPAEETAEEAGEADAGGGGDPDGSGGGRNQDVDFKGERRSNATHRSSTDADARLMRKGAGKEAKLAFMGHALMENRNGLAVDGRLTRATGDAEPAAAIDLAAAHLRPRATLGADKGYDTRDFVAEARELGVTPHVAQATTSRRRSAIDGRVTRHAGYALSQRIRKRIEEIFGWLKTVGGMRKTRFRGLDRVEWSYLFALAAYNLTRLPKLLAQQPV